MTANTVRPFYGEYAWAFDLLIDRPVRKECGVMAEWLVERGLYPGATILDAGCGTGRYAVELARRGYLVDGVDRSPELIDVAKKSVGTTDSTVSFRVGDVFALPRAAYQAILCRGVLNDLVDDQQREAVFGRFAEALRPGGVLMLDVREWEATTERKLREPLFRKRVATDRGTLTFTSISELDQEKRQLLISETHTLDDGVGTHSSEHAFVMRCWTRRELEAGLERGGFSNARYFGAYDPTVSVGQTDRLVVVAQSSSARR